MTLCPRKFADEHTARRASDRLADRTGHAHSWYPCRAGAHWHVADLDKAIADTKAATAKKAKDTGPGGKVRRLVWLRDEGRCVGCGIEIRPGMWWSMQHRIPRQVGGNDPANLLTLCGSATSKGCHRTAEDRDLDSKHRGLWIPANTVPVTDPATVPVFYAHEGAWYLLDNTGVRRLCNAPEGVPA